MKKIGIWGTGCMSLGLSNAFDKNEADIFINHLLSINLR